jgi:hypothetical protein
LTVTGTGIDFTQRDRKNLSLCETCVLNKMTNKPHDHPIEPGQYPMDLIHSDVVGPIAVCGFDGSRYFATFQCDKTKFAAVYLMKSKGELTDCFIHFKQAHERPGMTIHRLRDDKWWRICGWQAPELLV